MKNIFMKTIVLLAVVVTLAGSLTGLLENPKGQSLPLPWNSPYN